MKKNITGFKAVLAVIILTAGLFALSGCGAEPGGTDVPKPEEKGIEGVYHGVACDYHKEGVISFDEAYGFDTTITLDKDGNAKYKSGDYDEDDGTYTYEDGKLEIDIYGPMECKFDGDVIILYKYLGNDIDAIFAREGTEADDPSLYVTEEE